ncbi:hypothetical protein [Devosia sp.]|uniref:hypothetical protein n=1 Tax=Devosia sp. TaxID=1871048 RepID=UPI0019ED2E17|nr:hypothetical protein [Devosia sp.]MBE0577895.1 hypothetical protein [Devosia sp.]
MRAFRTLSIAALAFALAHPVMAQDDPHHPAGAEVPAAEAPAIIEAPADKSETPGPNAPANPMMGCADMMGMMAMMQSMQTMQMEMMRQMLEMQKALPAAPSSGEEASR